MREDSPQRRPAERPRRSEKPDSASQGPPASGGRREPPRDQEPRNQHRRGQGRADQSRPDQARPNQRDDRARRPEQPRQSNFPPPAVDRPKSTRPPRSYVDFGDDDDDEDVMPPAVPP